MRIPAGWLDPFKEVTVRRNPHTNRVTISQDSPPAEQDFFDFLRECDYQPDPGFEAIALRDEPPRDAAWTN